LPASFRCSGDVAATSLIVMPVLSFAQRHTGRRLASASAVADSKQEMLCTYLPGVVLLGLAANAVLDWSCADPVVGLAVAAAAIRVGRGRLLHLRLLPDLRIPAATPSASSSTSTIICSAG
jgi:divalent metal cation (Fe/Co/Zn/Cd) transporter